MTASDRPNLQEQEKQETRATRNKKQENQELPTYLPGEADEGVVEAGEGEADARVRPERVQGGPPEQLLDGLDEEAQAPDGRHVERQRHRRERHREEQLQHNNRAQHHRR